MPMKATIGVVTGVWLLLPTVIIAAASTAPSTDVSSYSDPDHTFSVEADARWQKRAVPSDVPKNVVLVLARNDVKVGEAIPYVEFLLGPWPGGTLDEVASKYVQMAKSLKMEPAEKPIVSSTFDGTDARIINYTEDRDFVTFRTQTTIARRGDKLFGLSYLCERSGFDRNLDAVHSLVASYHWDENPGKKRSFSDEMQTFELQSDDTWSENKTIRGASDVLAITRPPDRAGPMWPCIHVHATLAAAPLKDQAAIWLAAALHDPRHEKDVDTVERFKLDGEEAVVFKYSLETRKFVMRQEVVITRHRGTSYTLILECDEEHFDAELPAGEPVLKSLRWTDR